MSIERTISRRIILSCISAAGALRCATLHESAPHGDAIVAKEFALKVVSNQATARAIATTYLAQASPSKAARLLGGLIASLREESRSLTRNAARRLAIRLVESDFRNARIAIVDGWRLSNTEVALCVFVALSK